MHAAKGSLRRLLDEPFSVSDDVRAHVANCERCTGRLAAMGAEALEASRLLQVDPVEVDVDDAWRARPPQAGRSLRIDVPRRWRAPRPLARLSVRGGIAAALAGVVLVGAAAAATVTTVFAPSTVAPVPVTEGDLQGLASLVGLAGGGASSGQPGERTLPFGTLSWSSVGQPATFASLAAAEAAGGITLRLPTTLPNGVAPADRFEVRPGIRATLHVGTDAPADVAGATLRVDVGPMTVAIFPSIGSSTPALAIAADRRPSATASGASLAAIEQYVLGTPGFPPDLAAQLRVLLSNNTTLPVPVPAGEGHTVSVNGQTGVVLSDQAGDVSAILWEGSDSVVHLAGGLLSPSDLLRVADQVG